MDFTHFGLHPQLLPLIDAAGYSSPTPIQEQSIPLLLAGRDVLGLAQTGTGKTAAFVLPILHRLAPGPRRRPRCLVIAPTRELAAQIEGVFAEFAKPFGLRSCAVYGGVGNAAQLEHFRRGTEIVVACPGRLLDHLQQKNVSLSQVETLVLDEADHMFDMGFLPNIRRIIGYLPQRRQTMLFSATMPGEIRHLAMEVLHNPETVEIGHKAPVNTVTHALYPVAQHLKAQLLFHLLDELKSDSVIVFTRTKFRAKRLSEQLVKRGQRAAQLQGNMSQNKRQDSLDGFRSGNYQILVATDIAARGIDVSSVSHVINFDMPDTVEAYTHRIGRTGRALQTGQAFTLVTDEDRSEIAAIERLLRYRIKRQLLPDFDYNEAPSQQHREAFSRAPLPPRGRRSGRVARPASANTASASRPGTRPGTAGRPARRRPDNSSDGTARPANRAGQGLATRKLQRRSAE
jgi:ATP-dependent RNA helicase RhlE